MRLPQILLSVLVLSVAHAAEVSSDTAPKNPLIDYEGFLSDASKVGLLRAEHRVSEEDFLRMAAEPDAVILDARSADKYEMLHIAGARHLALTDVTAETLAKVIPTKNTRILIYCNNNFLQEPIAFASKTARASLNIYTFNTLYSYGYRNVYELAPLADIRKSKLPFEGTRAAELKSPSPSILLIDRISSLPASNRSSPSRFVLDWQSGFTSRTKPSSIETHP
jgi:hypothetical protein